MQYGIIVNEVFPLDDDCHILIRKLSGDDTFRRISLMRPYAMSFAAALLLSAFGVSADASDTDFKLVDKTGFPIDEVHVSPHRTAQWTT